MKLRPRVFISCGQSTQNDERDIALRIGQLLDSLGYDPYVAVVEKTLRGLKENLFACLSESDYYLFVDFKREPISKGECRGSLFSHQELAIAAYLDMPVLAFQEEGVRGTATTLALPVAARIHEGVVWSNRDRRSLLDKLGALLLALPWPEAVTVVADADYAAGKFARRLRQSGPHLVTRVRSNAIAFFPVAPAPSKRRGRPKK